MISAIITVEVSVISQGCDNTNQDVDYSGYHKTKFNNIVLLYIVSKKIMRNIPSHETQFIILAKKNRQVSWKS